MHSSADSHLSALPSAPRASNMGSCPWPAPTPFTTRKLSNSPQIPRSCVFSSRKRRSRRAQGIAVQDAIMSSSGHRPVKEVRPTIRQLTNCRGHRIRSKERLEADSTPRKRWHALRRQVSQMSSPPTAEQPSTQVIWVTCHAPGSGPSISDGAHQSHGDKSREMLESVPQTNADELDRLVAHALPQDVAQAVPEPQV